MKAVTFLFISAIVLAAAANGAFAITNTALQFDGSNDYVVVPDSDVLSPQAAGQMTLSTWVKIDSLPISSNEVLVTKGAPNSYEYNLGIEPAGTVSFTLWRPSGSHYATVAGGAITTGLWHNITGTFKQNDSIKIFLDGVLVNQSNSFTPSMGIGSGNFYFGKINGSPFPSWLNGALDNVSLWNYAMTDAQVQQLVNTPLVGSESGLVAAWNFNEGSGQMLTDVTGQGHNGTLGTLSSTDVSDPTWVAGVPEPVTLLLLGLGGLLLRNRRV